MADNTEKTLKDIIYGDDSCCENEHYQYGAMELDLCGLSPEDYEKTIFTTK